MTRYTETRGVTSCLYRLDPSGSAFDRSSHTSCSVAARQYADGRQTLVVIASSSSPHLIGRQITPHDAHLIHPDAFGNLWSLLWSAEHPAAVKAGLSPIAVWQDEQHGADGAAAGDAVSGDAVSGDAALAFTIDCREPGVDRPVTQLSLW